MSTAKAVYQTELEGVDLVSRGKVRDIYDLGEHLLIVATDRLSAFDYILPNPIPDKGKILNRLSLFWFKEMEPLVGNHVVSGEVADYPEACRPYAAELRDRSMLVKKAEPIMAERCWARSASWAPCCGPHSWPRRTPGLCRR